VRRCGGAEFPMTAFRLTPPVAPRTYTSAPPHGAGFTPVKLTLPLSSGLRSARPSLTTFVPRRGQFMGYMSCCRGSFCASSRMPGRARAHGAGRCKHSDGVAVEAMRKAMDTCTCAARW